MKFLFGFLTILLFATPTLANVVGLGFDKSEYLIEPGKPQRINVQLKDSAGVSAKATETTDVYLTAESLTAAVSTKVSEPYNFVSPVINVKLTVSKNTAQRGFIYKDSVLGSSLLTATGSARASGIALSNGSLKITIGFPPPPPLVEPEIVETVAPVANLPKLYSQASYKKEVLEIPVLIPQVEVISVPTEVPLEDLIVETQVLSAETEEDILTLDSILQALLWLKEEFFGKMML